MNLLFLLCSSPIFFHDMSEHGSPPPSLIFPQSLAMTGMNTGLTAGKQKRGHTRNMIPLTEWPGCACAPYVKRRQLQKGENAGKSRHTAVNRFHPGENQACCNISEAARPVTPIVCHIPALLLKLNNTVMHSADFVLYIWRACMLLDMWVYGLVGQSHISTHHIPFDKHTQARQESFVFLQASYLLQTMPS